MTEQVLVVGQKAPDFTLKTGDGQTLTLSSVRGKKVVLYFYPKDDTPGCTKEACSFQDELSQFTKANAVVLGVSGDSIASHQRFAEKFHLTFPLLGDPDASVSKAYGVYKQKSMYGRTYWGIERTTFIIDEQGRIARIFPKVSVNGHTEAVLEALGPSAQASAKGSKPSAATPATTRRASRATAER